MGRISSRSQVLCDELGSTPEYATEQKGTLIGKGVQLEILSLKVRWHQDAFGLPAD